MDGEPDPQEVARLEDQLAGDFAEHRIDFVPDPMVMRAAELFLWGRRGCLARLEGVSSDEAWGVIDKNLDGLLAFFHVLMTRECIPLVDYEWTFPGTTLLTELEGIAVAIRPPHALYELLAKDGLDLVESMNLRAIEPAMVSDVAMELGAAGYEWFPQLARFEHLGDEAGVGHQVLATFILGGIIFGGYAQAASADHLLQTKRARLFTELTVPQDERAIWGFAQEERLYARLRSLADENDTLRHADFTLPPSVVPLLLTGDDPPSSPLALLERAVLLRDGAMGDSYREWHRQLRAAWAQGRRDLDAEASVDDVSEEVQRRFGLDRGNIAGGSQLTLSGGIGVNFGIVQLGAAVEHEIPIGVPDRVRQWLVEQIRFRGHRKMLLRMSLAQASFDNLALGLRNLWWAA